MDDAARRPLPAPKKKKRKKKKGVSVAVSTSRAERLAKIRGKAGAVINPLLTEDSTVCVEMSTIQRGGRATGRLTGTTTDVASAESVMPISRPPPSRPPALSALPAAGGNPLTRDENNSTRSSFLNIMSSMHRRPAAKICAGFVFTAAVCILLAMAISWTLRRDGVLVTGSNVDRLRDSASHADCVRSHLFPHLQYFIFIGFALSTVFGRLRSKQKMCRRIPAEAVMVLLLLWLLIALSATSMMRPPHCTCEGGSPLYPFCTTPRAAANTFKSAAQANTVWERDEIRDADTVCTDVAENEQRKQQCRIVKPVQVDPLCHQGINRPWADTSFGMSGTTAASVIKGLDLGLTLMGIPKQDIDDSKRIWLAGRCQKEIHPVCPILRTKRLHDLDKLGQLNRETAMLLRDIVSQLGCDLAYHFCDRKSFQTKVACGDHVCCMLNMFKARLRACKRDLLEIFVADASTYNSDIQGTVDNGQVEDSLNVFSPEGTPPKIYEGLVGVLRSFTIIMPRLPEDHTDQNALDEYIADFVADVNCSQFISGFNFMSSSNCLPLANRSSVPVTPRTPEANATQICPCEIEVEVWAEKIQILAILSYAIGAVLLMLTVMTNCLPSSMVALDVSTGAPELPQRDNDARIATCISMSLSLILVVLLTRTALRVKESGDTFVYLYETYDTNHTGTEHNRTDLFSAGRRERILSAAASSSAVIYLIACVFSGGAGLMVTLHGWVSLEDNLDGEVARTTVNREERESSDEASSGDGEATNSRRCPSIPCCTTGKSKGDQHEPACSVSRAFGYIKSGKQSFDLLFSYEKGQLWREKQLLLEAVEVFAQIIQVFTFSPTRPKTWVTSISTTLLLNGLLLPLPFALTHFNLYSIPTKSASIAKVICASLDAAFDLCYFLIANEANERAALFEAPGVPSDFLTDRWWVALAGLLFPAVGMVLTLYDIAEAARNEAQERLRQNRLGKQQSRVRRSMFQLVVDGGTDDEANSKCVDAFAASFKSTCAVRVKGFLIGCLSLTCVLVGSIFLHRAEIGDRACASIIGSLELSQGADPKFVILSNLDGGCNTSSIQQIMTKFDSDLDRPLVELPEGLARLTNLRSLVVQDHSIAPSGAHVLNKLTGLTHLDLSGSPIISSADFSGMKNLTSMPSFLFDFLGETMRELSFSRTAIKEWHPGIRLMRTKGQLRRLDLSFTRISYLPPCILRDEACDVADESLDRGSSGGHSHELELLNLTGTPVSRKVDWSAHALGSRVVDILLSELAKWLPQVEHLVLAGNRLTRMPSNLAAFNGITLLNFSCNSDMRATKDPMDYWSPVIRLKSSLKILDLSNTGLSQTDFGPNKITCDVYRFFEDANAGGVEVVLLPQNRLQIFGLYPNTDSKQALCKHNKGLFLRAYWNIFKLIAGSQIAKVIGFDNEIIINNAEEIRDQVWDKYPDAYTQRGMFQILYESRKGSAAGLQNLRRVAIRDVRLSLMAKETSTPILRLPELLKFQNLLDLDVKDSGWSNELFANVVTTLTRLTGLTVSQGRLTGKLPAGLWKLTRLKNLNILECGEYGDVSNISKLVDLTYLSLNGETGGSNFPSTIGKLSKLIYFRWLGNHKSGGIIPDGVSELVSMNSFFIDDGNISGTIPRALFKMGHKKGKRLRISLKNNRLHGLIPRISDLAYRFECGHNALSGFFPDAFNHTQMLVEFFAHNNRLEGRIPVGLSRNRFFCKLGLNNNFLSGPIPNELTEFDPSYFRWLDLSNNNFSGTVPEAFMRYVADDNVLVCLNLCGNPLLNLSRLEPASGNPLALALYKKLGQGRDENGTLGNLTNAGPICQYGLSQQELLSPVKQLSLGLSIVNYSICEDGQGIRQRLGAFCETY